MKFPKSNTEKKNMSELEKIQIKQIEAKDINTYSGIKLVDKL